MTRLRIAVWHNLPSGGGYRALTQHIAGLVAKGHEIAVWSPPGAHGRNSNEMLGVKQYEVPRIRVAPGRLSLRERLTSRRFDIEAMDDHCRRCARQMESQGFDVILAHPCLDYRVTAIGRVSRLPSIVYVQEPYRPLYESRPGEGNPWSALPPPSSFGGAVRGLGAAVRDDFAVSARRIQVREEVRNARGFQRILVNSHFSRESLARAYGIQAHVCYLGVDSELFRPEGRRREPFVLGLGYVGEAKRMHAVIGALAALATQRRRLVWVGNAAFPDYLAAMRVLAQRLNVPLDVRIGIPDRELVGLLNQARLLVYAPRLEPFGFAALEAAACALPVVAGAEGGIRETVIDGETGLLTDGSETALASAIDLLLSDPERLRVLGNNGRSHVQRHWSLQQAAARLQRHLYEVISQARQSYTT